MLDRSRRLFDPASLKTAWAVVLLWVLGYAVLKVFVPSGLDMDSAEQVYFAQSWQMGYGSRQPPLYTWLILALKPAGASWALTLEVARYACLLLWLLGVQMLARVSGAGAAVQARTLLLHLGLMLVMWRVHDSLTHTVLAGCIAVWGSVALVKALGRPVWWTVVGALGALACLAKLNGALWCASSFLAAWIVLLKPRGAPPAATWRVHLLWMLGGLLVFAALMAPYAQWWLARPSSALQAQRIVGSDAGVPLWWPLVEVLMGSLEYTLLGPWLITMVAALRARRPSSSPGGDEPAMHPGMRWMAWQSGLSLLLLIAMLMAMKGSHFTPRWVWPVAPGVTVWLCVWALQTIDRDEKGRGRKAAVLLCTVLPMMALLLIAVRVWEPHHNARRCGNCWTDRPAQALSQALHARHGAGPLRIITGDDHLAGILFQAAPADKAWTSHSADLPPPEGFARAAMPCVAAWLDMDKARPAPDGLKRLVGPDVRLDLQTYDATLPMARAPQRSFRLQSRLLPASVCDRAPL